MRKSQLVQESGPFRAYSAEFPCLWDGPGAQGCLSTKEPQGGESSPGVLSEHLVPEGRTGTVRSTKGPRDKNNHSGVTCCSNHIQSPFPMLFWAPSGGLLLHLVPWEAVPFLLGLRNWAWVGFIWLALLTGGEQRNHFLCV